MSGAQPGRIASLKIGRNDPCPCGSGKKFKHCCEGKRVAEFGLRSDVARSSNPTREILALRRSAEALTRAGRWGDALKPFADIARLDPDNAQAHFHLGAALRMRGFTNEAAASLRRALELKPGFDDALAELAQTLEDAPSRLPEAAPVYRKLSRRAAEPKTRLFYSAKALALEGKLEEATDEARRALAIAPRDAKARILLATLLTDRGLFDEAAQEYAQAVDANPQWFYRMAMVKRFTEADRPLIDRMRRLVEAQRIDSASRVAVHYGLGKAFDDLRDYAEAMRHYDAANGLSPKLKPHEKEGFASRIDALIANFGAELLERAAQSLARPRSRGEERPVFVVGMPRSGTTLTEQILSSHPAVGSGGELPFWHDRRHEWGLAVNVVPPSDALSKAREDYLALLDRLNPAALRVVDKSPKNFMLLHLIWLTLPQARIIHCRRHPIDTCLSMYFANFGGLHPYSNDRESLVFMYRQYERVIGHWRSVLPPDRFTEVDYEKLVTDREAETRRLIAFIGLEWHEACLAAREERTGRKDDESSAGASAGLHDVA